MDFISVVDFLEVQCQKSMATCKQLTSIYMLPWISSKFNVRSPWQHVYRGELFTVSIILDPFLSHTLRPKY